MTLDRNLKSVHTASNLILAAMIALYVVWDATSSLDRALALCALASPLVLLYVARHGLVVHVSQPCCCCEDDDDGDGGDEDEDEEVDGTVVYPRRTVNVPAMRVRAGGGGEVTEVLLGNGSELEPIGDSLYDLPASPGPLPPVG